MVRRCCVSDSHPGTRRGRVAPCGVTVNRFSMMERFLAMVSTPWNARLESEVWNTRVLDDSGRIRVGLDT